MAKLKPGEKRVQLSFQRPEDLRLWAFMEKRAYECRWELPTFILASLTEAFKDRMEEDEVESIAAEAAQKVRERTAAPAPPPPVEVPFMPMPVDLHHVVSMEEAVKLAEAEIAALDSIAAKTMGKRVVRKGVPPMPK